MPSPADPVAWLLDRKVVPPEMVADCRADCARPGGPPNLLEALVARGYLDPVELAALSSPSETRTGDGEPPPDAPLPPLGRVAQFDLLEELGHGGMGVVYKARDRKLLRDVALKVLRGGAAANEARVLRFQREARTAASLKHPRIVQVHEVGEADGHLYIAMDYVPGRTLRRYLQEVPRDFREGARLVKQVAEAIAFAHAQGIIHRDVKPENVLVDTSGRANVADFGLAKELGSTTAMTLEGTVLGTPNYMAPEQAEGRTADIGAATDIYGVGAVLYEVLSGRPPFEGQEIVDVLYQVVHSEVVPPSRTNPRVPRDLELICMKCLEKEVPRRYGSALELADDLGRFLAGEAVPARSASVVYRLRRWVGKRKGLAASLAGLGAALMLASFLGWTWLAQRREQARSILESEFYRTRQAAVAEALSRQRLGDDALLAFEGALAVNRGRWQLWARRAEVRSAKASSLFGLGRDEEATTLWQDANEDAGTALALAPSRPEPRCARAAIACEEASARAQKGEDPRKLLEAAFADAGRAVAIENAFLLVRAGTGAPPGASTDANLERRPAEEVSRAAPPSEGAEQEVDELLLSRFGRDVVTLLTQVLEGGDDLEGVLKRALAATVRVTGAERGFILLFEGKDQVRVRSAFNLREEEFSPERFRLSFGVIEHLVRKGKPVRASNVAGDERFQGFQSVQDISLASFVAVPVPGKAGPQGVIYVDSTSQKKAFTPEDEVLLVRFADFLARALGMAVASQRRVLELAQLQQALAAQYRFEALIGEGPAIRKVRTMLDHVVRFPYPVLVIGETGTGKELVAKAIHANSPRKDRPLVAVNCAALPRELLESELFGHVKGAFTGADRDRPGLFKSAHQGTLFLDEIGETSEELQRKLLRVLQEGEFAPVGATAPQRCDVRIVAATNRDLEAEVHEGRFREDLYFRLKVFKVVLPPLRERPEDVPLLARFLLDKAIAESGAGAREIHAEAAAALGRYAWPGNVRELENAMRHAVAFSHDVIRPEHLPPEVVEAPTAQVAREVAAGVTPVAGGKPADELWKALIERTLEETAWNQSAAAKLLGITRTTLRNKIRGYGIERR